MRFYLVSVAAKGYTAISAFSAATLEEAARIHVNAYLTRKACWALIMRDSGGKRYSFNNSKELCSA